MSLIQVSTSATDGAAFVPFAGNRAGNGSITNDTGVSLDLRLSPTGAVTKIASGLRFPFNLVWSTAEVEVRRTDQVATAVTVELEFSMGQSAPAYVDSAAAAAAVAGHDASAGAHGAALSAAGVKSPPIQATGGTGDSPGSIALLLPFDAAVRGVSRDSTKQFHIARVINIPAIDGGTLDIVVIGDDRLTCVSFPCDVDLVGKNIIDVRNVGNEVGRYNTRLIQGFERAAYDVGIATTNAVGQLIDRLVFSNLVNASTARFVDTNIDLTHGRDLIRNGGFTPTNEDPDGTAYWNAENGGVLSTQTNGSDGGYCLQIAGGAVSQGGQAYGSFATVPGSTYYYEFWQKKGTGGNALARVSSIGSGGTNLVLLENLANANWTKYSGTFVANTDLAIILFELVPIVGGAGKTTLFDEVRIYAPTTGGGVNALSFSIGGLPITVGANDSGGTGKRALTIANA